MRRTRAASIVTRVTKIKSGPYFFRFSAPEYLESRGLNILRQTNKKTLVVHALGSTIYTEKMTIKNKINCTQALS